MLNEQQLEVVHHDGGPLLVLSCPGSGKTRCITERIINLLKCGVDAENVLAVTFTNKAANEMLERIEDRGFGKGLTICTFHSLCVRILRRCCHLIGWKRNFSICDQSAQHSLLKRIVRDAGHQPKNKFDPKYLGRIIDDKRNQLLTQEEFEQDLDPEFIDIFREYEKTMKMSNSFDFGGLISHTVNLLKSNPRVTHAYSKRFEHILVDEMQDTNFAQLELVKLLSKCHNNIIVVGDGDQNIFSWRGASLDNIYKFDLHFPDSKVVFLNKNYRCVPEILNAAEKLINKNANRKMIPLIADRQESGTIEFNEFENPENEAEEIANLINQYRWDGYELKEMAILCRINSLTRVFEECFRRRDIPYTLIGSFGFYDRKEVKTGLSFMKFLSNPEDIISFSEIINVPSRGIGPKSITKVLEYAIENNIPFLELCSDPGKIKGLTSTAKKSLINFAKVMSSYDSSDPDYSMNAIFEDSGYLDYLRETDRNKNENREDNVLELLNGFSNYCRRKANPSIDQYLQEVMLMSTTDNESQDNAVNLMTAHASKGLEFDIVFVPGMEEDIFPHKRSVIEGNIAEERRVCYVACTRARYHLHLTKANTRISSGSDIGTIPSRFLEDMEFIEIDWDNC